MVARYPLFLTRGSFGGDGLDGFTLSSEDAELAVAHCCLTSTAALAVAVEHLAEGDFHHPAPRTVYMACRWLFEHGTGVNGITVRAHLSSMPAAADAGGAGAVDDCLAHGADPDEIRGYVGVLKDRSLRRSVREGIDRIGQSLYAEPDARLVVDQAEREVFSLRGSLGEEGRQCADSQHLAQWFDDYLAGREEIATTWPYPLRSAQQQIGGLGLGELAVLAGYSGDGKSVMALQHLEAACAAGARVGYWSLEMPERQIQRRLVAMAGISIKALRDRSLLDRELRLAKQRLQQLRTYSYDVYAGTTTVERIRAAQMRNRYDLVIIDHLHRMANSESREHLERYTRSCKDLALDTDCAVLALAQLARREDFPPPTTNQLRGTDVLTQEADTVCFVYRDRDTAAQRLDTGRYIIAKVRDGEADTYHPVKFTPLTMSFRDIGVGFVDSGHEITHVGTESRLPPNVPERPDSVQLDLVSGRAAQGDEAVDGAGGGDSPG